MTGIREAVSKAGGQQALADAVGVQQPAVSKWVRRGWVSYRRAADVSKATGVAVRALLHPAVRELMGVE